MAGELQQREAVKAQVQSLYTEYQFSELNQLGSDYLKTESRTSSGLWHLTLFYAALAEVPNSKVSEPAYWAALKQKAESWIKVDDSLSFAHLFYADILISEAWMYRGADWGRNVREEDSRLFHEAIHSARDYLEQHAELKNTDPRWYEIMITVAKAQGWEQEEFYRLLDEATALHPEFYQIYFNAFNYLRPRWHGSVTEIEKFADYAVSRSRATEGNGMYARFYWYASQVEYGHKLFTDSAANWQRMKMGIDDVLKSYPDQWNINNFAVFSCLANDREMTRKLIGMIEGRPNISVWKSGRMYQYCLNMSGLIE